MTTPRPRVVCIGIATIDAIVEVDRLPGPDERIPASDGVLAGGGVAATAAVTLARLGVPTAFVGRVGDDRSGRWIRDDLAAEGVDAAGLALVPGRSPLSVVLVERATGARALVPSAGDAGPITLGEAELEACAGAEWVHLDQAGVATLPALIDAGIATPISVDDGVVGAPPVDLSAVALYGPTEAVLVARYPDLRPAEALVAALGEGPRLVVATRGGHGSVAVERRPDGERPREHDVAAWPGAVRSTLGAGDVFHGALLAGLVEGMAVADALVRASACAGLSCAALDGRTAIPTREELDDALRAAGRLTAGSSATVVRP